MKNDPNHSSREAQLVTYIHHIIVNAATNYYKKESKRWLREQLLDPEGITRIQKNIELYQRRSRDNILESSEFADRLANLTDQEWALLVAKYEFRMTDEEIASYYKVTRQAINRRRKRLLGKLRRL